jgi:raffinose/stachyose/melibiose transport system permease protein
VLLLLACAAPVAYALSRYTFALRSFLFAFFLAGVMIPMRLVILPLYLLISLQFIAGLTAGAVKG